MPRAAKTANGLTVQQNRFVEEYLRTGNATGAYRQAYNTSRAKDATVRRAAKELLDNPTIGALVARRQEKLRERTEVSLEAMTAKLEAVYEAALLDKQYSAAVAAQKSIGEFHGFKVADRANARDPFAGKTDEELLAMARGYAEELAKAGTPVH